MDEEAVAAALGEGGFPALEICEFAAEEIEDGEEGFGVFGAPLAPEEDGLAFEL